MFSPINYIILSHSKIPKPEPKRIRHGLQLHRTDPIHTHKTRDAIINRAGVNIKRRGDSSSHTKPNLYTLPLEFRRLVHRREIQYAKILPPTQPDPSATGLLRVRSTLLA